jgi:hypothetical protein
VTRKRNILFGHDSSCDDAFESRSWDWRKLVRWIGNAHQRMQQSNRGDLEHHRGGIAYFFYVFGLHFIYHMKLGSSSLPKNCSPPHRLSWTLRISLAILYGSATTDSPVASSPVPPRPCPTPWVCGRGRVLSILFFFNNTHQKKKKKKKK